VKTNTVERFEIKKVHRREIHGAPYNPQKISPENEKKLRIWIKEAGLLQPIVVNKRSAEKGWTGNDVGFFTIVGGHKRLKIEDALMHTDDYECTVSLVDLTLREEVRANSMMNQTAAMGEWDVDKLAELNLMFPDLDYQGELGFQQADLDVLFAGLEGFDDIAPAFAPKTAQAADDLDEIERMQQHDNFKAAKKKQRDKIKARQGDEGDTWDVTKDDYTVTFVFETNRDKHEFMKRLHKAIQETHLRATVLFDIADGKYDLKTPLEVIERNE
jgi:hypothetical protein